MVFSRLIEKLDDLYYYLHRVPTLVAYHTLNWTKYTSCKFPTAIGCLGIAAYNATILGPIVESEGVAALINNSLDSPERFLTELSVLAIDVVYPMFFAKNWMRASVAEERETMLDEQSLSNILQYEDSLQRINYAPTAFWYTSAEAVWPIFTAMAGSLGNPVGIINLASIMSATACLYGARYVLSTEFNSKKNSKKRNEIAIPHL